MSANIKDERTTARPLAAVTGASTGIGYELARCCAEHGFDLLIAANEPAIEEAAQRLRTLGGQVQAVDVDLATRAGVDQFCSVASARPIDALLANAGRGLGHAFLDENFEDIRRVIDTNVTGTVYLIHKVGAQMRARGRGRILITGSIAGFMPGSFSAVYNGTKAFLDSFSLALRNELENSGVTVTCLMPGPTDTLLRSCRHARYEGRHRQEGRSGNRRADRLRRDDERRGRRRRRREEQAASSRRRHHAQRSPRRAPPQNGRTRQRRQQTLAPGAYPNGAGVTVSVEPNQMSTGAGVTVSVEPKPLAPNPHWAWVRSKPPAHQIALAFG